jgi:molybdenum cofactor synthesis domain-containing protein
MKLPTAEIVCLGNELLIGVTVNTNATFIGDNLTKFGYEVRRVTCIRDDLELAADFFYEVFNRKPDIVIVSGGLGPTYDDIQLEVISKATGIQLQENSEALAMIETYYNQRGLSLSKERRKMAKIPIGSTVLKNDIGGAPGCFLSFKDMSIFCLPGVPSEMKDIFTKRVAPLLKEKNQVDFYEEKFQVLNCFESQLAPYINEVKGKFSELYIKSHPAHEYKAGIVIHISGVGGMQIEKVQQANKLLQELFQKHLPKIKIQSFTE